MCDTPATDTRIGTSPGASTGNGPGASTSTSTSNTGPGASTGTGTGTGKRLVCETPDLECWLISAPRQAYLASAGWLIGH